MSSEKQYPGYFMNKKVRVEKTTGIVTGLLREIVLNQWNAFLVVEISEGQDQLVNIRHVASIEEGVN